MVGLEDVTVKELEAEFGRFQLRPSDPSQAQDTIQQ